MTSVVLCARVPARRNARSARMRPMPPRQACIGDCDGNGVVAINDLLVGVGIALGQQPANTCAAFANYPGMVDIAQLVTGVNNALNGCAGPAKALLTVAVPLVGGVTHGGAEYYRQRLRGHVLLDEPRRALRCSECHCLQL